MEQTFEEYLKETKKVSDKRNHKIKGSVGSIDGFYHYRKIRPDEKMFVLSNIQYLSIIREMNFLVVDEIINNGSVNLPEAFGRIEVIKHESNSWIDKDGNLVTTKPVDIHSTMKLWYEDEECRNNKTLVRYDNEYTFKLRYNKRTARCKDVRYFKFQFGRYIKSKLKDAIVSTDYDAFEKIKRANYE